MPGTSPGREDFKGFRTVHEVLLIGASLGREDFRTVHEVLC